MKVTVLSCPQLKDEGNMTVTQILYILSCNDMVNYLNIQL